MELEMQSIQPKAKVGSRYINKRTKEMCTVTWKCFFNVGYETESGTRITTHYKRFNRNWREVSLKCRKCGLDCRRIGGSQWLEYACEKENKVEEDSW